MNHIRCSNCNGSGKCPYCNGDGILLDKHHHTKKPMDILHPESSNLLQIDPSQEIKSPDRHSQPCPMCNGTGKCPICNGTGLNLLK